MSRLALALLVLCALGCAAQPISPTYSEAELRAICERQGGRWLADDVMGGYCETPGKL